MFWHAVSSERKENPSVQSFDQLKVEILKYRQYAVDNGIYLIINSQRTKIVEEDNNNVKTS